MDRKSQAIKATTMTEGWEAIVTIFTDIVKVATDKAMEEQDDEKAIPLLRKAKATREAVRDLLNAVLLAQKIGDEEEPQWFGDLRFTEEQQQDEQSN